MNIQSTKRSLPPVRVTPELPAAVTPEITSEPKETTELGEGVRHLVGGVAGVGMSLAGVYAGVLGGAVVGSLFGAGMGPAISSVATEGALGFVGGIWNSTSAAAKIGMVVGGASGLVGGFKLGKGIGDQTARLFGGTPPEKSKPKQAGKIGSGITTVLTGLGSTSGLVGGGLIGAGLGATGSMLAQGFNLASIGGSSLVGAGVGAVIGTAIAGAGSYMLSRNLVSLGSKASKLGNKASELGAKIEPDPKAKTNWTKHLLTVTGAGLGAVAGVTPLLGSFANGVIAADVGTTDDPTQAVGKMACWVAAGTGLIGSALAFFRGEPLWLLPAAVSGAIGHGILHATGAFKGT
jgi:hypothetical protein